MPKNVTPNCTMIDLILSYFKGIVECFDELCDAVVREAVLMTDLGDLEEVERFLRDRIGSVDSGNVMVKIFSLKSVKECEEEINA